MHNREKIQVGNLGQLVETAYSAEQLIGDSGEVFFSMPRNPTVGHPRSGTRLAAEEMVSRVLPIQGKLLPKIDLVKPGMQQ